MTQGKQSLEPTPTEPRRVRAFAKFFKNYMSISSLVTAALPIPVTALRLIPTWKAHVGLLSTYTSLFCFLVLGFIFYSRHVLARWMFPRGGPRGSRKWFQFSWGPGIAAMLPAVLIIASLICVYYYHSYLNTSIVYSITNGASDAAPRDLPPTEMTHLLNTVELWQVPYNFQLMGAYLGIFVFAEAAFILMAIREYLQDLLQLSERSLIRGDESSVKSAAQPKITHRQIF